MMQEEDAWRKWENNVRLRHEIIGSYNGHNIIYDDVEV